jgi:hypothetical protein
MGGSAILCLLVLNAIVLERGLVAGSAWYRWLWFTIPVLAALVVRYQTLPALITRPFLHPPLTSRQSVSFSVSSLPMEKDILFEEVQTFARNGIHTFFKVIVGLLLAGSALSFIIGSAEAQELATGLVIGALISGIVSYILGTARLITQVRTDGIYVRFPPLQGSFSRFGWVDIGQAYIRTYSPLAEYGGWGIRIGLKGRAYNVAGNQGLQLVLHNGRKVLIGTAEPERLAAVLRHIGKLDSYME